MTVWAGESERVAPLCHNNSGVHNQNSQQAIAPAVLPNAHCQKCLHTGVDMYELRCVFQLINNIRSHKTLSYEMI